MESSCSVQFPSPKICVYLHLRCITQPAYTLDVINIHAFKTQKTVEVVHRVCDAFFLFALRALLACIALRCVRLRLRLRLTALRALVGWLGTRLQ